MMDLRSLSYKDVYFIKKLFYKAEIRILACCAPCQPFSTYTQGRNVKDGKWDILYSFEKLIREIEPEIVTMENVSNLVKHGVFRDFIHCLNDLGYYISTNKVFCPEYGIPQTRTRLVVLASRLGEIDLLPPTHRPEDYVTVRDVICDLDPLEAGGISEKDILHRASRLSERNYKRIVASIPGGSWRDWDEELVSNCHKKRTGSTYSGVYGRMEWDKPAPTITTQCFGFGNGRFGHPEQNRAISLREAALLQTFPHEYQFVRSGEEVGFKKVGMLIGNAVPIRLAQIIAKSILRHVGEYNVEKI